MEKLTQEPMQEKQGSRIHGDLYNNLERMEKLVRELERFVTAFYPNDDPQESLETDKGDDPGFFIGRMNHLIKHQGELNDRLERCVNRLAQIA